MVYPQARQLKQPRLYFCTKQHERSSPVVILRANITIGAMCHGQTPNDNQE